MILGQTLITAILAAALASGLYVGISTAGVWSWRQFFAITAGLSVIIFVLLSGGAITIG